MISIFTTFFLIISIKVILFRISKIFKNYWFDITLLIFNLFFLISVFLNELNLDNLIIASLSLIAYTLFMTLVFNSSPTLKILENPKISPNQLIDMKFVENRINLMKEKKLLIENKVTKKGKFIYKISELLSLIFLSKNTKDDF